MKETNEKLLKSGTGVLVARIISVLSSLIASVSLARILGPQDYGVYSYIFALTSMLAIPTQLGLPTLVVRETAIAEVNQDWGSIKGIWNWADAVTGLLSFGLIILCGGIILCFPDLFNELRLQTFGWSLLLIPLIALGNLRGASLRGLKHVAKGQFSATIVRSSLLSACIICLSNFSSYQKLNASQAMALHVLAAALALLLSTLILRRVSSKEIRRSLPINYQHQVWLKSMLPLALFASVQLIRHHTDILMLGIFTDTESVGIYQVSLQGANLVSFSLSAANMVVAPHFAQLYIQGKKQKLQRTITYSSRIILGISLPTVLLLVLFGNHVLSFVFGESYASGAGALSILALGQLGNAAMGSIGLLLNMSGNESYVAGISVGTAILNGILNFLLIPTFGMNGAAAATSTSLITWNLILWRYAKSQMGIDSTAFARLGNK